MPCYKCGNTKDGTRDTACQECCKRAYPSLQKRSFQSIVERMKLLKATTPTDQVQLVKEALW